MMGSGNLSSLKWICTGGALALAEGCSVVCPY